MIVGLLKIGINLCLSIQNGGTFNCDNSSQFSSLDSIHHIDFCDDYGCQGSCEEQNKAQKTKRKLLIKEKYKRKTPKNVQEFLEKHKNDRSDLKYVVDFYDKTQIKKESPKSKRKRRTKSELQRAGVKSKPQYKSLILWHLKKKIGLPRHYTSQQVVCDYLNKSKENENPIKKAIQEISMPRNLRSDDWDAIKEKFIADLFEEARIQKELLSEQGVRRSERHKKTS
jgi:hypothetical protein